MVFGWGWWSPKELKRKLLLRLFLWFLYICSLNLRAMRKAYGELKVKLWVEFFSGDTTAAVWVLFRRIGFDVAIDISSVQRLHWRSFGSFWFRIARVLASAVASFAVVNGGGSGRSGGGGAEGAVSLGVDSPAVELPLDVGVPVVLDLIISSSR